MREPIFVPKFFARFECSKCVCDDSNAQCDELFGGMAKLFHQFVDKDGRLRIVNLKYFR